MSERQEGVGYVYKYVDTTDGIVKYVGLVNPGNSLQTRINQHKRDDWWSNDFDIYYVKTTSKTDCESLEAHLIECYRTYDYYNKAKSNWGMSSYIDESRLQWIKYIYPDKDKKAIVRKNLSKHRSTLKELEKKDEELKKRIMNMQSCIEYDRNKLKENHYLPLPVSDKYEKTMNTMEVSTNKAFDKNEVLLYYMLCKEYDPDIVFTSKLYDMHGNKVFKIQMKYSEKDNAVYYGNGKIVSNADKPFQTKQAILDLAAIASYNSFYPSKDIYQMFVWSLSQHKKRYEDKNKPIFLYELLDMYWRDGLPNKNAESVDGAIRLSCSYNVNKKIQFDNIYIDGIYIDVKDGKIPDSVMSRLEKTKYFSGFDDIEMEEKINNAIYKFSKEPIVKEYIA